MNTRFDDPEDLTKPSAPCTELIGLLIMIDCARRVYERKGALKQPEDLEAPGLSGSRIKTQPEDLKQADELRALFNTFLRSSRSVAASIKEVVPGDISRECSKVNARKAAT